MNMNNSNVAVVLAWVCVLVLAGGMLLLPWAVQNFRLIPDLELTEADKAKFAELGKAAKEMGERGMRGELPWRYIDSSSVGDLDEETQLLLLFDQLTLYVDLRGEPPASIDELSQHGNVDEESQDECLVFLATKKAVILNCDGWVPPQGEAVDPLLDSFVPRTVKFYRLNGHIVLYVPPHEKIGRPARR